MAQYTDKDYKFEGDKLIWANPDLYLKNPTKEQYIFTDQIWNGEAKISIYLDIPILQGNYGVVGHGNGAKSVNILCRTVYGNVARVFIGDDNGDAFVCNIEKNKRNFIVFEGRKVIVNGTEYTSAKDNKTANKGGLFCTTSKKDGLLEKAPPGTKIYSFKYEHYGSLIRHLVPVPAGLQIGSFTVPSNGMFDIVEQKFYANQGTGEFEFGKDASRICIETAKSVYNIINKIILNQFVEITDFVTKKTEDDLVTIEYNVTKKLGIDAINRIQVCSADGTILTDTTVYQPIGDSGETLIRHTFNVTEE